MSTGFGSGWRENWVNLGGLKMVDEIVDLGGCSQITGDYE